MISDTLIYEVKCDDCGLFVRVPSSAGVQRVRRFLRAGGWSTVRGAEYCPKCRDKHLPKRFKK